MRVNGVLVAVNFTESTERVASNWPEKLAAQSLKDKNKFIADALLATDCPHNILLQFMLIGRRVPSRPAGYI